MWACNICAPYQRGSAHNTDKLGHLSLAWASQSLCLPLLKLSLENKYKLKGALWNKILDFQFLSYLSEETCFEKAGSF